MRELTDHLIAAALRARAGWLREGLRVPVSVNLATANLLDAELPARVAHRLAEAGANASALRLELTETALMVDAERSAHVLGGLRRLGVGLSLDHFGAGNSSLSMLKRLPVDQLKLDRAFGKRVADDARDASIVAATLLMAGPFGLTVVAEGVESEVAYSALRLAGCPVLQGFAIAEPMPAERLPVWARAWATARPMWARGSEDGPAASVVAGVRTLRAR
jgi:EAL domain-containing protein (putative c-di-GMP-specific phosphodiesterase class I)